jgi:hypothetical protein
MNMVHASCVCEFNFMTWTRVYIRFSVTLRVLLLKTHNSQHKNKLRYKQTRLTTHDSHERRDSDVRTEVALSTEVRSGAATKFFLDLRSAPCAM